MYRWLGCCSFSRLSSPNVFLQPTWSHEGAIPSRDMASGFPKKHRAEFPKDALKKNRKAMPNTKEIRRPRSACTVFLSYVESKISNPKSPVPKLQKSPKSKIPKIQKSKIPKIQNLHIKICYIMFQNPKSKIPKIQNPQNLKSKIQKPSPKSKIWGVGGLT